MPLTVPLSRSEGDPGLPGAGRLVCVTPTRISNLFLWFLGAGVLGWILAQLTESFASRYLPVPWLAALAVWLLAISLLMWTVLVRPRLQRKPDTEPLEPQVAARTAALAMASSRTGAAVAGFYLGIAAMLSSDLAIPAAQENAIVAVLTALGGFVIVAVALWLEHICRIDEDDDDDSTPQGYSSQVVSAPLSIVVERCSHPSN